MSGMKSDEPTKEAVILIYQGKDGGYYCPVCDYWFLDPKTALDHVYERHKADWITCKIRKFPKERRC